MSLEFRIFIGQAQFNRLTVLFECRSMANSI